MDADVCLSLRGILRRRATKQSKKNYKRLLLLRKDRKKTKILMSKPGLAGGD